MHQTCIEMASGHFWPVFYYFQHTMNEHTNSDLIYYMIGDVTFFLRKSWRTLRYLWKMSVRFQAPS